MTCWRSRRARVRSLNASSTSWKRHIGTTNPERRNAGYRLGIAPTVGAMYDAFVKVIARATLYRFVENRVARKLQKAVKAHLEAWYAEAERATWKNSAELKSQYRSASVISAERVVFNIKGNEFRLIVAINYHYQVLLIKWWEHIRNTTR